MRPPATRQHRLSRELTHLLEQANALSVLSHAGRWPKAQARAMAIIAISISRHALSLSTTLSERED